MILPLDIVVFHRQFRPLVQIFDPLSPFLPPVCGGEVGSEGLKISKSKFCSRAKVHFCDQWVGVGVRVWGPEIV